MPDSAFSGPACFFVYNEYRVQSVRYSFSAERKYFCRGSKNVLHFKMQLFNRFTGETEQETQETHRRVTIGDM